MQKVFVTGGSGFLGRELLAELQRRGNSARALGAEPVAGDLDDVAAMQAGMADSGRCDVVVHAAAYAKDHRPRDEFYEANVQGTENVLAAAKAAGLKRLVHISTEAVLADGKPIVRADEDAPLPAKPVGLWDRLPGQEVDPRRAGRDPGQGGTFGDMAASPQITLARARAHWHARTGLAAPLSGDPDEVVARTGWVRTPGGADVYLAMRARVPGLSRKALDGLVEQSRLRVTDAEVRERAAEVARMASGGNLEKEKKNRKQATGNRQPAMPGRRRRRRR